MHPGINPFFSFFLPPVAPKFHCFTPRFLLWLFQIPSSDSLLKYIWGLTSFSFSLFNFQDFIIRMHLPFCFFCSAVWCLCLRRQCLSVSHTSYTHSCLDLHVHELSSMSIKRHAHIQGLPFGFPSSFKLLSISLVDVLYYCDLWVFYASILTHSLERQNINSRNHS